MRQPAALFLNLAFAACLLCSAAPLHAEPAPGDAVLQMLQDKGLLPSAGQIESSPLVQQVRDAASDLVMSAMNFLGVRYRRGGNSAEQGFDCSGFTRHVFERSVGLVLPRRADQQAREAGLLQVAREDLKPGDLVFFNTLRRAFSHVGIYVGEGRFIHAPRAGGEVRIEDMRQAYWVKRFNGARRAEAPAAAASGSAAADTAAGVDSPR
ncbi:Hydrolase [Rubrivivax sp. A210]|uniref:C40 family peptidase n=1 Tax=Rubrivivax sp. A210 TaxID=2772301 RepID=UPI001918369C|nr:C40 family peptidase [Rubrivivax sp. A210]CAD5373683.1 Hydrolase [Rubrivivax sp. A210]